MEKLIHPDFTEVGASGRRWTRSTIIDALVTGDDPPTADAYDFNVVDLAVGVALVTYTTASTNALAHRCSIWVHDGSDWSVIYHQGTPAHEAPG